MEVAGAVAEGVEVGDVLEGNALVGGKAGGVGFRQAIGKGCRQVNGFGVVGEPHRSHQ